MDAFFTLHAGDDAGHCLYASRDGLAPVELKKDHAKNAPETAMKMI
ncbi:hypothetical protein [Prosthecobacter fluviatilis]|uniref:Uncharacterized protein n=1 Tax=Prosthecobacter fluviatilis TaxID=445931 RepID=A0ABW0KKE0_9BACT